MGKRADNRIIFLSDTSQKYINYCSFSGWDGGNSVFRFGSVPPFSRADTVDLKWNISLSAPSVMLYYILYIYNISCNLMTTMGIIKLFL